MRAEQSTALKNQADPRFEAGLLLGFLLLVIALGVAPRSRVDWALENLLAVALVLTLIAVYRRFRLSAVSLGLVFVFLCVHEVGSHYTYSHVPYDQWGSMLTGISVNETFGLKRNYYDRLVHLSYGVLMLYPMKEVLKRLTPLRGKWLVFIALNVMLSTSALYELIEWIGGAYLGDDTGQAFVGAQDDPWDSQKDMALALVGAMLASFFSGIYRSASR